MSLAGDEQPRFLHRHVARNYTSTPYLAARYEPEAVTEAEQRDQTTRARRRWQQEQQRAWGKAATTIGEALSGFVTEGHPDSRVLADVKAVERATQRVGRHLGLG